MINVTHGNPIVHAGRAKLVTQAIIGVVANSEVIFASKWNLATPVWIV